jgi:hypothetical protein
MSVTTTLIFTVLAAAIAAAALRKLSHRPEVVASYERAGVPERWLNPLAALLLAAAAGLLAGLAWPPLGLATTAALVAYFAVAIAFHLRARDYGQLATPIALEAVAGAALVLRAATL